MLRWEQRQLAEAANVSLETIKRLEKMTGSVSGQIRTIEAVQAALETAGVAFTNGGEPGVKLAKQVSD